MRKKQFTNFIFPTCFGSIWLYVHLNTNCFNDTCLFPFHSLFLFSDFSTSIGMTRNMEQISDTVTILVSALGVIIFLFIVVVLQIVVAILYKR